MKSNTDRRNETISILKKEGVDYLETLPLLETSEDVALKDIDTVCKRAVACLVSTQVACDLNNGEDPGECAEFYEDLLKRFDVGDVIFEKESGMLTGTYSDQDVIDIVWTYEAYWSLVWALGLIDDISDASNICDCEKAIRLVSECETYADFRSKCNLRDIEEILDMLDLYYNYHWACEDRRIGGNVNIGPLNPEVVMERRRGLEWLVSEEEDWNEISLDT